MRGTVSQSSRVAPRSMSPGVIMSPRPRTRACRASGGNDSGLDDESTRVLVLPGGELWWLGWGGKQNSALVPVKGSNELAVYGATTPQANLDETTSIVLACGRDRVDEEVGATKDHRHHRRRTARVSFTCNLCMTRNEERPVNPDAYRSGSVFARCTGCGNTHKLVDNLQIFHETFEVFPPPDLRSHFLEMELFERIRRLRDEEQGER